jgi:hypothetical protein
LATAVVAAVVIGVSAVLIIRQKKIKAEKNFEMELISREAIDRTTIRMVVIGIFVTYFKLPMFSRIKPTRI